MTYFAAVLARSALYWSCLEVDLSECESLTDIADVVRDVDGDIRLLVVEQDDEYLAIVRVDGDEDARAFLSDGHAADAYPLAALIAEDIEEIGGSGADADDGPEGDDGDDELVDGAPPAHDSAPFGEADIVEDLDTTPGDLLAMCAHEGTLPIDILVAICERAGCADAFEGVRA